LKILTGIKPTGIFHIGNHISTIRPILNNKDAIILIADQHALISNPKKIKEYSDDLVKIFLSFGFGNIVKQSEIPEISELNWILSCFTEIGYLNRSHAFKSLKESNIINGFNENKGVTAGLFNYPTLMTADNAIFDMDFVAIGPDQLTHIELAKMIVNKFNHTYKTDILKIPEPIISNFNILGFDGRKMSKSYNNTIPLFCSEKNLKKHIFSMKTNSKNVGEPKYLDECPACELYKCIASKQEVDKLEKHMINGLGWGEIKDIIFTFLNHEIQYQRDCFNNPDFNIEEYRNMVPVYNIRNKCKIKLDIIKDMIY
jgi:tryptophanyl-tRNA synthetase